MKKSAILWCFATNLVLELIFLSNPDWISFRVVTKPLLVSFLLLYFLLNRAETKTRFLISLALLFSLLGDVLLLFTDRSENYFMFGLLAFLLAHIFYIIQFSRERNKNIGILKPLGSLLIFGGLFFYFLKDDLGSMLLPVCVYMIIILMMAFFAFLRKGNIPKKSFELVFTGAILFLISDATLAIDKFHSPISNAGILIMGTYGLAQLFIVLGILKSSTISVQEVQ